MAAASREVVLYISGHGIEEKYNPDLKDRFLEKFSDLLDDSKIVFEQGCSELVNKSSVPVKDFFDTLKTVPIGGNIEPVLKQKIDTLRDKKILQYSRVSKNIPVTRSEENPYSQLKYIMNGKLHTSKGPQELEYIKNSLTFEILNFFNVFPDITEENKFPFILYAASNSRINDTIELVNKLFKDVDGRMISDDKKYTLFLKGLNDIGLKLTGIQLQKIIQDVYHSFYKNPVSIEDSLFASSCYNSFKIEGLARQKDKKFQMLAHESSMIKEEMCYGIFLLYDSEFDLGEFDVEDLNLLNDLFIGIKYLKNFKTEVAYGKDFNTEDININLTLLAAYY
jgi:hypothetical protein